MLRLEWNSLRVGDRVLVHDAADADLALVPGVVAMVQTAAGSNDIGVRVTAEGAGHRIVRPARLAVHLDPWAHTETCWRCDALAASESARVGAAGAATPVGAPVP